LQIKPDEQKINEKDVLSSDLDFTTRASSSKFPREASAVALKTMQPPLPPHHPTAVSLPRQRTATALDRRAGPLIVPAAAVVTVAGGHHPVVAGEP
jgi:hypothetical protein